MKEDDIRKQDVLDRYLELVRKDVECFFRDSSSFEHIPCPACGSSHYRQEFCKIDFHYVSCLDCETLYVNPRPSSDQLTRFYVDSPSARFWINDFFKPMASSRQEKIFKPRAERMTQRFGDDPCWTVGDIGAGFGLFLEELKRIWKKSRMIAIEPSPEMAEICRSRDLEVIQLSIEEIRGGENSFDLLVAFELIEHLYNPRALIEYAWRFLKPGGWLHLTTLNVHGFDIQVLWNRSKAINPPHHLNFLNPEALAALLASCDFHVVEILTPGRLDYDIVEGMIEREHAEVDRFWRLVARKASPGARVELQDWITRNKLSSHMSVYARKPL